LDQQTLDILLVDDDEFFADIVAGQLRDELKHRVTIARGGRQAKELLENSSSHFDIILTDYYMPGMNGLDLLQWMYDNHIETPVVMLTAVGSDIVAVDAMKLGAYDYVRKEQLDLQHLGVVINATNERHRFRVAQSFEEERAREIKLNTLATDKVRDVLNAITPTLNSALANINGDIETQGEELCKQLPSPQREQLRELLKQIQHEAVTLETSVRGLLGLYRMLYAHHAEARELDRLKREIEERVVSV
jgi:Response regulator containing CheY-like receiver, AAA-type ATPase, and DNA-binding domains